MSNRNRVPFGPLVLVALMTPTLTLPLNAQGPDFSGTWTLDVEASELPTPPAGGGQFGGGRRGGGGGRGPGLGGPAGPVALQITQSVEALVMEAQGGARGRTTTYRLDGEDSINATRMGEMTTRSTWDGPVLVTRGSQELSTPRGDFTIEIHERRSLSDDGSAMTVTSTRSTPRGEVASTLVFRRSSE